MTTLTQIHDELMAVVEDYRMGSYDLADAIRNLRRVQAKGMELGVPIIIEDIEKWLVDKAVKDTIISETSDESSYYYEYSSSSSEFLDED